MSRYKRNIEKHRHGFTHPELYCLTPWTFECVYPGEMYSFYVCASSDHRTWEDAMQAAEDHLYYHTDKPLTADLVYFEPGCVWPEDA